ncbi:MAG: amidohydrolase family protein [Cyclobacteriaceae bacterium]
MRVDSHQHFWNYDPEKHSWISDNMQVLRSDFLPEDLLPSLQKNELDGCVAVQADQSEEETKFLLKLASENPFIKGVVGWIDLKSDNLSEQLEAYKGDEKLKGFRHIVQDEPDGFMTDSKFVRGVKTLADFGYTYDILIFHNQLPEALDFVCQLPEMKLVVDHCAKPDIKNGEFESWKSNIEKLAAHDHLYIKISGLVTEANWNDWKAEDFKKYIDAVVNAFGEDRIMFGSDWPVCQLAATYDQVMGLASKTTECLTPAQLDLFFGKNASRFYNL